MAQKTPSSVFVLMPFRGEFEDVYQMIREATTDSAVADEVECRRADEISALGRITDHILSAIRDADVIVADLTGSNPNVMYELGFAHALEKPTIIMNQSVETSPFDVAGLVQILYDRHRLLKDCRPRLVSALLEVLSGGATAGQQIPTAEGEPPIPTLVGRPTAEVVAELQTKHLRMELENRRGDKAAVQRIAGEAIQFVNGIAVVGRVDEDDLRNTVLTIGNCAVECEKAGLSQEAEDLYKRGIGLSDSFGGIHVQYADFLVDEGRYEEARRELDRARQLDPSHRRIRREELKLAVATGSAGPSIGRDLKAEFEANKGSVEAGVTYLVFLDSTGATLEEFERVCGEWEQALPKGQKRIAKRALADKLAKEEDRPRAKTLYQELLPEQTGDERAHVLHNLATVCAAEGIDDEAESYWREAYELNPKLPEVQAAFSQWLSRKRKLEVALKVISGEPID